MLQSGEGADEDLLHIGYTLLEGRQHFHHRIAVVARSREEAVFALTGLGGERDPMPNRFEGTVPRNFTGQSMLAQYVEKLQRQARTLLGDPAKYREALYALADLYCQGYELDGNELYGNSSPHLVRLPTYPFAREYFWVSAPASEASRSSSGRSISLRLRNGKSKQGVQAAVRETQQISSPAGSTEEAYELMTFEEVWEPQPITEPPAGAVQTAICFLSRPESKQAARDIVQAAGANAKMIFISQGAAYAKNSPLDYSIPDADQESYERALRSVMEDHQGIDAVLYLRAVEDSGHAADYSSIVRLVKAISAARLKPRRSLLAGRYETHLERCHLDSWIGFERSLGLVMPGLKTSVVLVESGKEPQVGPQGHEREWAVKDALQKLWAELLSGTEQSVLYREGRRHVSRVRPVRTQQGESPLRQGEPT
ncbi:hypothetical protein LJK87_12770 [Paenibacillus sp. P25]|nr:hypothetical protein LJK87_12770 [Paenibacillus sp. P25]